jgi:hypothetical protein
MWASIPESSSWTSFFRLPQNEQFIAAMKGVKMSEL